MIAFGCKADSLLCTAAHLSLMRVRRRCSAAWCRDAYALDAAFDSALALGAAAGADRAPSAPCAPG